MNDSESRIKQKTNEIVTTLYDELVENLSKAHTDEEKEEYNKIINLFHKENNSDYISILALITMAQRLFPAQLKEIDIANISRPYSSDEMHKFYKKIVNQHLMPLKDSIYILCLLSELKQISFEEPDKEIVDYLNQKEFPNITILDDVEKRLRELVIKSSQKRDMNQDFIQESLLNHIVMQTINGTCDIKFAKELGKEIGIIDNERLFKLFSFYKSKLKGKEISAEYLFHDFMDIDELLGKYENGTISGIEKSFLQPEDYVYRYLRNYYMKKDNVEHIFDKVKITTITNMYRDGEISFEHLYILITESPFANCSSKDRERLKNEIRKLFKFPRRNTDEEQVKKQQLFRGSQLLKLAQIGLVSDEDMLGIYLTEQHQKEEIYKKYKSLEIDDSEKNTFQNLFKFTTDEEMREYYNADKLLNIYFNLKSKDLEKARLIFTCCNIFTNVQEFEKSFINDPRVQSEDYIFFFENRIISVPTLKKMLNDNHDIKDALYSHLKKLESSQDIFSYYNLELVSEDDLIEIFDDKYENILREALRKKYVSLNRLEALSYLDNQIIIEEYNNSLQNQIDKNNESLDELDLESIIQIYLFTENLVEFNDLYTIVAENKDGTFQRENFNLRDFIVTIINRDSKSYEELNIPYKDVLIKKIKELYMNNFLSYDELICLAENGILTNEQAEKINNDFINSGKCKKILDSKLGDSDELISDPSNESNNRKKPYRDREFKEPTVKQIMQAEAMVAFLRSIGFEPKTFTNSYGIEQMDTFSSGDFKNYRLFISKENPGVVVLLHLMQKRNTDTYYHVGDNATYIMSTASFTNYMYTSGRTGNTLACLHTTKSNAKKSKYTKVANVGKRWTNTVPRKIGTIMNMFENPEIKESRDANFDISLILPESLDENSRAQRLDVIKQCIAEVNEAREMRED